MAKLRVDKIAASGQTSKNTGSVFFDGNADHLKLANSTDFNYGSDDFSIEAWVYLLSSAGGSDNHGITSNYITSGNKRSWLLYLAGATPTFIGSSDGTSGNNVTIASSVDVADDTWTHIAVSRTGTTVDLYVNGVKRAGTTSFHSSIYSNTDDPVEIGGYNSGTNTFEGFISNLRICKGHRVYTSNFAPPTRELEVHPETVLLACYDGENIFADKSGRHILAAYGDRSSTPTPARTDSPVGITTENPGLIRSVDNTFGSVFQGEVEFNSENFLTIPKGTTTDRNRTGGRGLVCGGDITPASESESNHIDYITISTTGNSQDFGDLTDGRLKLGASGSSTRGIIAGGATPSRSDIIDFVTTATTGNAVDFGNLLNARDELGGAGNDTRALFFTGSAPGSTNVIEFVTTATLGNAQDFGDLTRDEREGCGCGSPTRGIIFVKDNSINYLSWATTGNAQDFGDTGFGDNGDNMAVSDTTRAIIAGGTQGPTAASNGIHYLTISTLGNTQDFGDLTATSFAGSGMSNSIRGVFSHGESATVQSNLMDYITIATTGDAKDFGDLTSGKIKEGSACSDSHGGIG